MCWWAIRDVWTLMDLGLRGRVAIIGGASKGIGRATAVMLAAEGCRVALAARGEAALTEALSQIGASGGDAIAVACDMSRDGDIKKLVAETVERFSSIDVVVNNAGGPA